MYIHVFVKIYLTATHAKYTSVMAQMVKKAE
jgi:hypothetical protein